MKMHASLIPSIARSVTHSLCGLLFLAPQVNGLGLRPLNFPRDIHSQSTAPRL